MFSKSGYSSGYDHVFGSVKILHCTCLVLCTRASSDDVDGFRLGKVDPLEEGRNIVEGLAQSVYMDIASCSAVGQPPYCSCYENQVLVWCLAGIDCEMPKLSSDDLVIPTVALHALLNSGIEAALMYLDSLRLPNCDRNPHFSVERHAYTLLSRS
ncbi:hypothetical protein M9H77_26208 [Catharanthus roseus]|uniref:Uncharacterized protein n=1 Tax=Catharanthus roseus TaxID=4058 RepID=A0ACC0A948_CATRO|nr:hypothetical protein M9H77_26208 [Catharanthus roseus]